jgi:uncharacterized 2Fe-2S/4Fe-4S cluster protein (DUF4445 family)
MDAARLAGVMIDLPCGGKGTCGKCLVQVARGTVMCPPSVMVSGEEREAGYVPACQAAITGDVTIIIPEQVAGAIQTCQDDDMEISGDHLPEVSSLTPLSRQVCVRIPRAAPGDGLADLDRVDRAFRAELKAAEIHYPLSVIRKLADTLRAEDGEATFTMAVDGGKAQVIDVTGGRAVHPNLGIAVDLGTTTVSVQLIDLAQGRVLSTRNGYNEQIRCGLDVISRINYVSTRERLEDLRLRAVQSINRLIRETGTDPQNVTACFLSGNTVMTHLLLGLNPEYIRLEPYTPTVLEVPALKAGGLGIDIHPEAFVRLSPCVGSYVGGDITAGILASELSRDTEEIGLFIDIGTNGEIVIGSRDFLMTCACSAGPAFEGSGIECGMRATTGAIDRVEIDRNTGKARCSTIGDAKPAGMCGSGLIDLLAGLFLTGWVDASGKFNRDRQSPSIHITGRRAYYTVAGAEDSKTGKPIVVSENDIENLMRAKAAIYSAASLMLGQVGITFADLAVFYVAGGFGRFLNIGNAKAIGLLPDIPDKRFRYLGNASLKGSSLCLLSEEFRAAQKALAKRMTYIDLSTFPGYMDQYTAALFLPHTNQHLFPGVQKRMNNCG